MPNAHRLDHRPFLVPPGKKIRLKDYATDHTGHFNHKDDGKEALREDVSALAEMQNVLWASKEYAVIVILQALDAAGKDGTIKHVMTGINPQGVNVYAFRAPKAVSRYVAPKGSICIDGVSLTVNRVRGAEFQVNLIPHTLKVTTLSRLKPGTEVNMEADMVARYVEGFSKSA